jgi:hypothetical protein
MKEYLDEKAQQLLDTYIETFDKCPSSLVINLRPGKARQWKEEMTKADLAVSGFIEARISPEMKEKLVSKFKEIYPQMLKVFERISKSGS